MPGRLLTRWLDASRNARSSSRLFRQELMLCINHCVCLGHAYLDEAREMSSAYRLHNASSYARMSAHSVQLRCPVRTQARCVTSRWWPGCDPLPYDHLVDSARHGGSPTHVRVRTCLNVSYIMSIAGRSQDLSDRRPAFPSGDSATSACQGLGTASSGISESCARRKACCAGP